MGIAALGMSLNVHAESLQFDSIRLNELAKLGYTQILDLDYIADNDFNNDQKTVSIYVKDQNKNRLKSELNTIFSDAGYSVTEKGGLVQISKRGENQTKKEDLEPFYYKPKYRDVQYLTDLVSSLFTTGNFTFKRQIQSANQNVTTGQNKPQDTGTTAYSQFSKPLDSFIFNGTKQETETLKGLLQVLDTPENQVQITAYLYEVSNTDNKQSSFSLAANLLGGVFKVNIAGLSLANSISFGNSNLQAGLNALAGDSRFNVISSPQILVKNRENGSFSVGADVPILGQLQYNQTGQAIQSVEYKPSGVIFDFTPIFRDSNIELTIHHQISNFVQTTNGVNNSPTLIKRELKTVVNSKFEDVILLGGLSETKNTDTKSGISFLPSFMQSKSHDSSKTDILLLLHVTKI